MQKTQTKLVTKYILTDLVLGVDPEGQEGQQPGQ